MAYDAKVFNVMIASPSDVASERSIIRDVIYEWNAIHSQSRNIVLLPIGWESHSSPEMGRSPQSIINDQVLNRCDLLVGVFWTRIGTQTSEFSSGTVEEIERHIQSERPAMLYFSSQPVMPETIDFEQFQRLTEFKTSCQQRGLYELYDSHSDFKNKFFHHLQLKLNEHALFNPTEEESQSTVTESRATLPNLSSEARIVLKESSLDAHGTVLWINHMGGTLIQVNDKQLIDSPVRREVARWESAVQELVNKELLVSSGQKGEIFQITNLGYQVADMIEL
ncbi:MULTISPECIES: hypothetical protein [Bacillus]|uniref:hypothetical protein n=1 Tax=Bacillus TaxID=1386 RepID=UPI00032F4268|nr:MULTISPECIES: hypothetical protein [Bacillus]EOP18806.1 hypothetical protein IIS_04806 [Bacillus cereus VD131]OFC92139.1 hypothetical protein BTGOE5_55850 [Bacillus thuringiensis]MBJ8042578.1 DUF4062 domain-containing protein [Bacillus cereus group sp. N17]MBJ8066858.1 DUF4062 domain-containing protein [Bacillus cereus group sp. N15]MCS3599621.1 hypothetical protein [Bacillus sp. JUb91]